jgi:hypothetical protein
VTFEVDHVVPVALGGETTPENLCLCCPSCNRHKGARVAAPDPRTSAMTRLFHPVRDRWRRHFEWQEGGALLVGRTPVGRTTVEALHINRALLVELRRYWIATGRHPPEE